MESFIKYLSKEQKNDVLKTLEKIPNKFSNLIKPFEIEINSRHSLKKNKRYVAYVQTHPKPKIVISSPWHHSIEFSLLHELGHIVWNNFVKKDLKKEWKELVKNTKNKRTDESDEENFCHAFASMYSKYKYSIHDNESWKTFISKL